MAVQCRQRVLLVTGSNHLRGRRVAKYGKEDWGTGVELSDVLMMVVAFVAVALVIFWGILLWNAFR
jgi:hypothetical protein